MVFRGDGEREWARVARDFEREFGFGEDLRQQGNGSIPLKSITLLNEKAKGKRAGI
jgi:hypothetical protein